MPTISLFTPVDSKSYYRNSLCSRSNRHLNIYIYAYKKRRQTTFVIEYDILKKRMNAHTSIIIKENTETGFHAAYVFQLMLQRTTKTKTAMFLLY